jgi:hypothetical protein
MILTSNRLPMEVKLKQPTSSCSAPARAGTHGRPLGRVKQDRPCSPLHRRMDHG